MTKAIWVVTVDNYHPSVCDKTIPSIKRYAEKIGAEFKVINERKWPAAPPPYEKLQVHEAGKTFDWNIIVDADMLIHDDMHDPTQTVPDHMFAAWMCYDASQYFPLDTYFYRDRRKLGISSNFLFVSKACHDLLTPFEPEEIQARMDMSTRPFILDEYCISRNAAKFGLQFCGILSDLKSPPYEHLNSTSGHGSHV